jgi:hypothetical protein
VLQAELGIGDSDNVCQLVFQDASSGKQFHEMRSRKIVVWSDDIASAADFGVYSQRNEYLFTCDLKHNYTIKAIPHCVLRGLVIHY